MQHSDFERARRIAQVVADVFGLKDAPDRTYSEVLIDALRPRHMLLLLDNCEHLIRACAALAASVLRDASGVRMLATSREPLALPGEQLYRVDPHCAGLRQTGAAL